MQDRRHRPRSGTLRPSPSGPVGTVELETVDEVRSVLEVDFFGVVAVPKEVLPHLRASGGLLVTVTSVGGAVGQPFNEAYCAAELAVEGCMESLAPVVSIVGIRVSIVDPDAVASDSLKNVGVDPIALLADAGPYEPAMRAYVNHVGLREQGHRAVRPCPASGRRCHRARLGAHRPETPLPGADVGMGASSSERSCAIVTARSSWG